MGKKCNWCGKKVELANKKPYCERCRENCERECIRCHRPFDNLNFFNNNEKRCDSCQVKYEKEKGKRLKMINDASTDNFSASTSSSEEDTSNKRKIVKFDRPLKVPKLTKENLAKIERIYNDKKLGSEKKIAQVQSIYTDTASNSIKKNAIKSPPAIELKQNDMVNKIMKKNSDKLFAEYAQNPILGGRQVGYILVSKNLPSKYSCEGEKNDHEIGYIPVFF